MIKKTPIKHDILKLIPKAEVYLGSRRDVLFSYLFGSFANKSAGPFSDVDIAVYLKGHDLSEKKLDIIGGLNSIFKTDEIDLVILNTAPLTLRMKILQNCRILSDNAPFVRHSYESITTRSYFDFEPVEKAILERRFFNGR